MFFNKKNKIKEKIPIEVLIIVSLAVFFALGIINFLFTGGLRPFSGMFDISEKIIGNGISGSDYQNPDPFITRNPNLADLLTGPIINPEDPALGDKYAKVNIFLFSDFTCDFCVQQEQVLKKIHENYRDVIKIYWKDYPEREPESVSFQAAVAGQCAGKQGRFWPYHDFLYEFNNELGEEKYFEIASLLKLDQDEFKKCWEERATAAGVIEDIDEADMLEISGIPFMYVGSQEVMGEATYDELERLVKLELEKNKK